MSASRWRVYIVETERGTLYTGITTALTRRLAEHGGGPRGARFFRLGRPLRLCYVEYASDRGGALKREAEIKRLPRSRKLALIAAGGTDRS